MAMADGREGEPRRGDGALDGFVALETVLLERVETFKRARAQAARQLVDRRAREEPR